MNNKREPREIDELLKTLIHARSRLTELHEACTKQRRAGELSVLQQTIIQSERLLDEIRALEDSVNPQPSDGLIFARASAASGSPAAPTR